MQKEEKLEFVLKCERYIEERKIRDTFEMLTKELVLRQPADPLTYLINFLESQRILRVFFIHGISDFHRIEISNAVTSAFNYKKLSLKEVLEAEVNSKGPHAAKIQRAWRLGVPSK